MSKLEEIIYCDTGCGSNADPADGFGYCTCGQEDKRKQVKALVLELIGEDTDGMYDAWTSKDVNRMREFMEREMNGYKNQLRQKVEEL